MRKVAEISSTSEKIALTEDIFEFLKEKFPFNGLLIAWTDAGIYWGYKENGNYDFYQKHWKDAISKKLIFLRIFNSESEIYIWKRQNSHSQKKYFCRIRKDNEGEIVKAVDAQQIVWGTYAKPLDEVFYKIEEARNIEIIVPNRDEKLQSLELSNINKSNRLALLTRNYIDYHPETGQAYFCDVRFFGVKLTKGGEK